MSAAAELHHGGADVCDAARRNAALSGDTRWLAALPALIRAMEQRWSITVAESYAFATEAFVARAWQADGTPVVLKLAPPSAIRRCGPGSAIDDQVAALRMSNGRGCVRLLRHDRDRGALLLERLGQPLADSNTPHAERMRILTAAAQVFWRPVAPGHSLPTGADQAIELARYIRATWKALNKPCTARTIRHAMTAAHHRAAAHDDNRAVLVHGDLHQWNALASQHDYLLVDPHGIIAEPEYDLGVIMREDPLELMQGDPRNRATELAAHTGRDEDAIWEWGVLQRVATGLKCSSLGMPVGPLMLAAADQISA